MNNIADDIHVDPASTVDIDWTKHETTTGNSKSVTGNPAYPLGGGGNYRCSNTVDVDAVEVVRCKECKWWEEKCAGLFGYCGACKHLFFSDSWEIQIRRTTRAEFFCADGELPGVEDEE